MSQPVPEISRQPIRPLSSFLANQIAAGEVVERPASIIKELLENALDAGASRIDILLERGGMQSILIRDNGGGIPSDELPLALAPHATSKIRQPDDLVAIESMGFRGEALASIASVSRLQLTSRFAPADEAWMIHGRHGDGCDEPQPASHPLGTSVQVQELFFNTPARRRFLRSERTEYRHCEDVVRRMALSHFEVAINFTHNQRRVYQLAVANTPEERERRVVRLCGKAFLSQALPVEYRTKGLMLSGWVGLPEAARPQADLQYFFVNGRIIRDRLVSHAVRQAYADSLFPGRYPAYMLYLQVPPGEIDVNVHPTKHEVRFHQGRLVHDFITHSLLQSLIRQAGIEMLPYANESLAWHEPESRLAETVTDISAFQPLQSTQSKSPAVRENAQGYSRRVAPGRLSSPPHPEPQEPVMPGRAFGIIDNRYAVYARDDGMLLVDIPRLQYQHLLGVWQAESHQEAGIIARPLLIPENLRLDEPVLDWIENNQSLLLQQAGLDLQRSGTGSALLRQIPVAMQHSDFLQWLPEALTALSHMVVADDQQIRQQLAKQLVRNPAGDWQIDEITSLLANEVTFGNTPVTSHPAVRLLDREALSTLFES